MKNAKENVNVKKMDEKLNVIVTWRQKFALHKCIENQVDYSMAGKKNHRQQSCREPFYFPMFVVYLFELVIDESNCLYFVKRYLCI